MMVLTTGQESFFLLVRCPRTDFVARVPSPLPRPICLIVWCDLTLNVFEFKNLTSQPKCEIKALHELSVSVCTDVVPTTSKAVCTCHRGWLHDLGNKFEMYGLPETTELTEYDLNYGNALYLPRGTPSANCWIWGVLTKIRDPQPKLLDDKVDHFSNPQIAKHISIHMLVYKNVHSNHTIFTSFPHIYQSQPHFFIIPTFSYWNSGCEKCFDTILHWIKLSLPITLTQDHTYLLVMKIVSFL